MKRTLFLITLACMSLSMSAYDFEEGGLYYNIKKNIYDEYFAYVTYRKDHPYSGDNVIIPSTVNFNGKTYPVRWVGEKSFYGCDNLTSVTIQEGVQSIGEDAFRDCDNLTTVNIPLSMVGIGNKAFAYCRNLTDMNIPSDSKVTYSLGTFWGCSKLANIKIYEAGGKNVAESCFRDCESLTSINIPDYTTHIGGYAFAGTGLTSIVIPNSVTRIEGDIFENCKQLVSVKLSENLTFINHYTFCGCEKLSSVTIPNSVNNLGSYSFYGCSSLKSIVIPSRVTFIGKEAFSYCSSLTSVYSLNSTPPDANGYPYPFDDDTYKRATLYVPIGSKAAYSENNYWKKFYKIEEFDANAIDNLTVNTIDEKVPTYNLQGIKIPPKGENLKKGIYIKNGKKVIVK